MNMRTVARRAGVSSATVSRVLNGSPLVRKETAEHVRGILDELNFIPNPIATTLKYGRSKTFGILVPDITNPFYGEFLRELEELLVKSDHELLLANSSDGAAMLPSIRRMLMRQVDGVVLMASDFDAQEIAPLLARNVPVVTVDRRVAQQGVTDVAIDFEGGLLSAVAHLRELGHTRIGFVGGTPKLQTSAVRLNSFKRALRRSGLLVHKELLRAGNYHVAGGEAAAQLLLQEAHPPTAILTANDLTAFGVLRALHRAGVSVPGHMSVIGLDDLLLADILQPPLTTIRISRREMAEKCVLALTSANKLDKERSVQHPIKTTLVKRESTAAPPAGRAAL